MKRLSWVLAVLVMIAMNQSAEAFYDLRDVIRYFGFHHGPGIHAHNGVEVYHGADAYPHYRYEYGHPLGEGQVKKSQPRFRR